nr:MAG TPA: hypothetical protein [Caudoviricetes sp.]
MDRAKARPMEQLKELKFVRLSESNTALVKEHQKVRFKR